MDHTDFNLQSTLYLPLPRKRSPDGVSTEYGGEHLIAAHYSFIDPERMKGWVGLVLGIRYFLGPDAAVSIDKFSLMVTPNLRMGNHRPNNNTESHLSPLAKKTTKWIRKFRLRTPSSWSRVISHLCSSTGEITQITVRLNDCCNDVSLWWKGRGQ